jgi:serine/threonine protein kinase
LIWQNSVNLKFHFILLSALQGRLNGMQGHGRAVDWWAFGVLIYEMLAGYPPFYEEDTTQTYQRILHGRFTFPADFPVTVRDLVRKLLQVCLA